MKTLNDYMKMSYRMEIVEDQDEGGFVVSYPDLPGCITCGETIESAVANAVDAKKAWLEAAGTDREAEATRQYLKELEADIVTAEGLEAFAESEAGIKVFGDKAGQIAAHAREIRAAGAKYCDCPACTAVAAILEKKDEMLR